MSAIARYAHASPDFQDKLAQTKHLIVQAALTLQPLSQASSLGAEDMVITHLLAATGAQAEVFVLDTGKLHTQTLALIGLIESRYGRSVQLFGPLPSETEAFEATHGPEAMRRSVALRQQCCALRKVEPLARALAGTRGWLTGLRRGQSHERSQLALMEPDGERTKVNPLAHWSTGDVWHFIALESIDYNPLHDQFYPSIGCSPCTRPVALGQDLRAGRWWWEDAAEHKECGLHRKAPNAPLQTQEAP
jgi:phosphoadenosine phosphosulfate reductase